MYASIRFDGRGIWGVLFFSCLVARRVQASCGLLIVYIVKVVPLFGVEGVVFLYFVVDCLGVVGCDAVAYD